MGSKYPASLVAPLAFPDCLADTLEPEISTWSIQQHLLTPYMLATSFQPAPSSGTSHTWLTILFSCWVCWIDMQHAAVISCVAQPKPVSPPQQHPESCWGERWGWFPAYPLFPLLLLPFAWCLCSNRTSQMWWCNSTSKNRPGSWLWLATMAPASIATRMRGFVIVFLNNYLPCLLWAQRCQYTVRGKGAEQWLSPWRTHIAQDISRASFQLSPLGLSAQASHERTPPLSHPAIASPSPAMIAMLSPASQATSAGVYHQADCVLAGFLGTAWRAG